MKSLVFSLLQLPSEWSGPRVSRASSDSESSSICDELWNRSDADLIELAKKEMSQISFKGLGAAIDGFVVRQPKAYPIYDDDYARHLQVIKTELKEKYPTFHPVGRNGMHKYNNQDHAIMTAMLTVKNILSGSALYDVWRINEDAEYHEEVPAEKDTELRV